MKTMDQNNIEITQISKKLSKTNFKYTSIFSNMPQKDENLNKIINCLHVNFDKTSYIRNCFKMYGNISIPTLKMYTFIPI